MKEILMNDKINAYKELQSVVDKYPEQFQDDWDVKKIKETLACLEMSKRFGIPLEYVSSVQYSVVRAYDHWTHVALYGEDNRQISWSDDERQPEGEWLYCICFTTGPYIFGDYFKDEYPKETFNAFFNELKSYDPKYIDSANKCLYFTEENSKEVYEAFWGIFNKYKGMVKDEMQRQRKKELEEELAKLNGEQE